MSLDGIFRGLADAEQQRYDRNEAAAKVLEEMMRTLDFDTGALEEAIVATYPPEELEDSTDTDTLRFDYIEQGLIYGPYDWWSEAQLLSCRFMRQAHDRGLSRLLRDLEYVRERATVQRVLAKRDLDRRWTHVRHARKEAAKGLPD